MEIQWLQDCNIYCYNYTDEGIFNIIELYKLEFRGCFYGKI